MTSEVSPSSDVEKDIGTIECIGRCLGGAFERDLLTHAKLIRAHIAALTKEIVTTKRTAAGHYLTWQCTEAGLREKIATLEAENKRLRDALENISNQRNLSTNDETLNAMRFTAREAIAQQKCGTCGGDGIERCDNPDHGLLDAISFIGANESRCPCCGHDEKYRMKTWNHELKKYEWNKCPDCNGSGRVK